MNLKSLPISFFDVALLVVLILGLLQGRKNGMSAELMSLLKWLAVVFVCAVAYAPLGEMLSQWVRVFSLLACYILAYLLLAGVIIGLFALVKHSLGGKLLGSDIFGRSEYYLGMGSGFVRFACILLAALALLNARYFSPTEVRAMEKYQNDVYGSTYFPGLQTLQATVFEESFSGHWIKENLAFLLIKPTAPESKDLHQREFMLPN
jgi:uncharacterized membrane protein required for colicin V production